MKKLFKLSILFCFLMVLGACSKDPEAPKTTINLIEMEPAYDIDVQPVSVLFSGNVDYKGKIKKITLKIGTDSSLSDAEEYTTQLDGTSFSVWVHNLNPNAEYHYCYSIDYGVSTDYVADFKKLTTPPMLPTVVTGEDGESGEVTSDGGANVTERGICWGKNANPDINGNNHCPASDGGTGHFSVQLPNLEPGMYNVRAYATNSVGTSYGDNVIIIY